MNKAFVLLSGGIDSTTCLGLAVAQFGGPNVTSYSVDYGQQHFREISAAQDVAAWYGVAHKLLHMGPQPQSPLTDKAKNDAIPDKTYDQLGEGISPSYHWFRNGQMLSMLAAYASAALGEEDKGYLFAGMHAEDAQNWAYPDCTPEFLGSMANAIYVGTYFKVRLVTPLMWDLKHEIIRKGVNLFPGVPYHKTYSCYRGGPQHCGACPTCYARKNAFGDAGVDDPTVYVS